MREATTIDFAIDPADVPRLAQRVAEIQAYGEQRLADAGSTITDIPAIVDRVLADPDPVALAEARLLVASIRNRSRLDRAHDVEREPDTEELAFREAAANFEGP